MVPLRTCSSSLDICWVIHVWMAPVQDASSLRRPSSFCMSSCKRANSWLNRPLSSLCSKEYVPATFLVLKKYIHTKDKRKFSLPYKEPFIIVDIAAPDAYVLAEVDDGMLSNTWNADRLYKYYACIYLINKDTIFLILHLSPCHIIFRSIARRAHQSNSKNDKSWKRDDIFPIWLDVLPQSSIRQFLISA
jgi:hypothetical protein